MAVYLVESELPGLLIEQLDAAQRAVVEVTQRFSAEGKPVRYLRSTFVPGDDRVTWLFEASEARTVREVNEAARIPFTRIVEALDLSPEESRGTP